MNTGKRLGSVLLATLMLAGLMLAGCSGYRYHNREPFSALGGWKAYGGGVERRFASKAELGAPLVELWRREDGICPWGIVASRGVVVLTTLNQLVLGLDAATGEELWRWDRRVTPSGPPQIHDGRVYLVFDQPNNQLWCLDLLTGARRWGREPDQTTRALLAVDEGLWVLSNTHLYLLSAQDGELLERHKLPGRPLAGPPVLLEERPAFLLRGMPGAALWSPDFAEPLWFEGEPVAGPLLDDAGRVIWAERDGGGRLYDPDTGGLRALGPPLNSPPAGLCAVDDGVFALGRDGSLRHWKTEDEPAAQPLLSTSGVCLVPPLLTAGRLWLVRAESGLESRPLPLDSGEARLWTWETRRSILSLAAVEDRLIVTTAGGATVALGVSADEPPPAEIEPPPAEPSSLLDRSDGAAPAD